MVAFTYLNRMDKMSADKRVSEEIEKAFDKFGTDEDTRNHPDGREGVFANNNNFSRDEWVAEIAFRKGFEAGMKYRDEQESKEAKLSKIFGKPEFRLTHMTCKKCDSPIITNGKDFVCWCNVHLAKQEEVRHD